MTHPIPNAALDDRLGFIGTSGSGKTYNAGGAVERLLAKKARVVIIDPLGVWWGLRLSEDGKHASGFNVAIFGGPRGDLPLNEHAGALIGETAATMAESCIIDLRELGSKASERRFMTAFLETLYRKATGEPFHLVVDEADLFAPQKPYGGDETLLGHMENIVRRGRVKGFVPWLISQRPAVVNKNVLSQVDGLIAFKLTSTQDRDALDAWIEGQADRAEGKAIKDSLPAMQIGQGVVWLPAHGILKTVQFPPKVTFDSSKAPKRGEKQKRTAALKPLDLSTLKQRLSTVEAETKANDPKALRAEIVALKRELAAKPKGVPAADIKAAEKRAYAQGEADTAPIWFRRGAEAVVNAGGNFLKKFAGADFIKEQLATWKHIGAIPRVPPVPISALRPAAVPRPLRPAPAEDGNYTRPQMRVLRSLAMWKALGHDTPSREMVAGAAGYSPGSGGFNNLIGGLTTAEAIAIPQPGKLMLAADSIEAPSIDDGRDMLLSILSNPHKKLVSALNGAGIMTRDALAEATGYSAGSGGFNNLIGKLNTLCISCVPQQGHVALSEWAQELLTGYDVRAAA